MAIATEELTGGITRVILDGKLDIEGAAAVDMQMNLIGGSRQAVLVDLQNVSYIGSMGLRAQCFHPVTVLETLAISASVPRKSSASSLRL